MKYKVNYKSAVYCKNMVDLFINNIISHHDDLKVCLQKLDYSERWNKKDKYEHEAIREEIKIHRESIKELTDAIKDMVPEVECNGVSYAIKEDFEAHNPNKSPYYSDERYTAIREYLEEECAGCLDLDKDAEPTQCFEVIGNTEDGTQSFGCCRLFAYDTEVFLCGERDKQCIDLAKCPEVVWESAEEAIKTDYYKD